MGYLYIKGKYEKYYFIYSYAFMHFSNMFNKIPTRQNKRLGTNLKH